MLKKIIKLTMCLLAVCTLCAAGPSAWAQTSEASIEITAGTGPTYPVNPEDPSEDLTDETPVSGSLAILMVSDFNFGAVATATITEKHNTTTFQPNIQVVDLRGTGTGWSVSASVSGFTNGGTPSLSGAVIHIYNGRPTSLVSAQYAPIPIENSALTADNSPVKVITAPNGTGMGLWVMRWYPSSEETTPYVQLEIPAGTATLGTHTATINWSLSDTP